MYRGEKMILQIDEAAYNNIIYALEYAILDLDAHNQNIYLDDKKKDLEKTLKSLKDCWNANRDQ